MNLKKKKKALRAVIFRTSRDVDRQLTDYKNIILIHQIHHTFKNAVLM